MGRGSASRDRRIIDASKTVFDGNMPCRNIGDHFRDHEGVVPGLPVASGKFLDLLLQGTQAANTGTPDHANSVEVQGFQDLIQPRIGDGFIGADDRKLGKPVQPPRFPLFDEGLRVKVFDLAGELRFEQRGVKKRDRAGAAPAGLKSL